jgi:hypothetical protein
MHNEPLQKTWLDQQLWTELQSWFNLLATLTKTMGMMWSWSWSLAPPPNARPDSTW